MSISDNELERDIIDALTGDACLDLQDLNVEVKDGVVALRGVVPSLSQRRLAEEVAYRIKGVATINNELTMADVEVPSDEDLAELVRENLARDARVPDDLIEITVKDRVVYLSGDVDSAIIRSAADDDARLVEGVRGVVNGLAVPPGPQRTDREIADEVRLTLLNDLLLGRSEIEVSVNDGVVTLRGSVPSEDWRSRVLHTARRVPGVLEAVNEVQVIG